MGNPQTLEALSKFSNSDQSAKSTKKQLSSSTETNNSSYHRHRLEHAQSLHDQILRHFTLLHYQIIEAHRESLQMKQNKQLALEKFKPTVNSSLITAENQSNKVTMQMSQPKNDSTVLSRMPDCHQSKQSTEGGVGLPCKALTAPPPVCAMRRESGQRFTGQTHLSTEGPSKEDDVPIVNAANNSKTALTSCSSSSSSSFSLAISSSALCKTCKLKIVNLGVGQSNFSSEMIASQCLCLPLLEQRKQQIETGNRLVTETFTHDHVRSLCRGTYGHPYLMRRNGQSYVLKFVYYNHKYQPNAKAKKRKQTSTSCSNLTTVVHGVSDHYMDVGRASFKKCKLVGSTSLVLSTPLPSIVSNHNNFESHHKSDLRPTWSTDLTSAVSHDSHPRGLGSPPPPIADSFNFCSSSSGSARVLHTVFPEEDAERPENADVAINALLAELVETGVLPFIVLPIAHFTCSEKHARDLMFEYDDELRMLKNKVTNLCRQVVLAKQKLVLRSNFSERFSSLSSLSSSNRKISNFHKEHGPEMPTENGSSDGRVQRHADKEKIIISNKESHRSLQTQYQTAQRELQLKTKQWNQEFEQRLGRKRMHQLTNPKGGVMVYLAEYASLGSLSSFLRRYPDHLGSVSFWRSILAQFLYTLAVLQSRWPHFRHNDLHPGNVLLERPSQSQYQFVLEEPLHSSTRITLPTPVCEIRLWDFDYASIGGVQGNHKVELSESFGISSRYNPYYDVHTFCNTILHEFEVPSEVQSFLKDIVPRNLRHDSERFYRLKIDDLPPSLVTSFNARMFLPSAKQQNHTFICASNKNDRSKSIQTHPHLVSNRQQEQKQVQMWSTPSQILTQHSFFNCLLSTC